MGIRSFRGLAFRIVRSSSVCAFAENTLPFVRNLLPDLTGALSRNKIKPWIARWYRLRKAPGKIELASTINALAGAGSLNERLQNQSINHLFLARLLSYVCYMTTWEGRKTYPLSLYASSACYCAKSFSACMSLLGPGELQTLILCKSAKRMGRSMPFLCDRQAPSTSLTRFKERLHRSLYDDCELNPWCACVSREENQFNATHGPSVPSTTTKHMANRTTLRVLPNAYRKAARSSLYQNCP